MAGNPSPLPTTVPPPQSATAVAASPAARAFFARLYDGAKDGLSQRRPWAELADRNQLAKPESFAEATGRIRKNWTYFRVNYVILLAAVLAISLVAHPGSLIILALLLSGWIFLYLFRSEPLVLFGRTYTDREVLGGMTLFTVIVLFLTSVGSLLISALMFGVAIICAHASFRVPEDLFLDEQEPTVGFLSFLGAPASVVATQA
ncbi:PRA1 family protein B4 [Nymphaea thermarum]|nr:PRA1 family protein B4 [Nymphaea thermarum]